MDEEMDEDAQLHATHEGEEAEAEDDDEAVVVAPEPPLPATAQLGRQLGRLPTKSWQQQQDELKEAQLERVRTELRAARNELARLVEDKLELREQAEATSAQVAQHERRREAAEAERLAAEEELGEARRRCAALTREL
jgi:chromosome segregation ATPase